MSQAKQLLAHSQTGWMLLQVPLHHDIFDRGIDGCGDQFGVAVAESVNADPRNEIEFDTAVGQFDPRAVAKAAGQIREERCGAACFGQFREQLLVGDRAVGARRLDFRKGAA